MTVYRDVLHLRIDPFISYLIREVADEQGTRPAEYCRRALRAALIADGVKLNPRSAGTLYDVVDGKRRWARVKDGEIHGLYYHTEKPEFAPGYIALPVTHEDSEPFDPAIHWRLTPHATLISEYATPVRVVVTYPIIEKSAELA